MEKKDLKQLFKAQQGELDAVIMYNRLADKFEKRHPDVALKLRELAKDEGRHASLFKGMTGQVLQARSAQASFVCFMMNIIGKKTMLKIISKGEYSAYDVYAPAVEKFPEIKAVQDDEKRHGDEIKELIKLL